MHNGRHSHTHRARVANAIAQRNMARAEYALAELERCLDERVLTTATSDPQEVVEAPAIRASDEPLRVVVLHAAHSVARSVVYRVRWRWRRLRRFGVRLREEYCDLRQLEVAARRDQSERATDREAYLARLSAQVKT